LSSKTDIPALSTAATAGAISVFVTAGPFGITNLMISITLMITGLAYIARNTRDWLESLAFALVMSFITTPGIGFLMEWKLGSLDADKSQVSGLFLFFSWVFVTVIVVVFDRYCLQVKYGAKSVDN
jgi:uncharacterized membrane protein YhaH (DUF805 family)